MLFIWLKYSIHYVSTQYICLKQTRSECFNYKYFHWFPLYFGSDSKSLISLEFVQFDFILKSRLASTIRPNFN